MKQKENLDNYVYQGDDLGFSYKPDKTKFKVWAPTANKVKLLIFEDEKTPVYDIITEMKKESNGIWSAHIKKDLDGYYYILKVYFADEVNKLVDPYARAVSTNSKRGLIFNRERTNPQNWDKDQRIKLDYPQDAVIYEVHVQDFSLFSGSGMKNKGKYLAFTEENTFTQNGFKTGVSHLKELGVTHVQLLPIFDFATVDEIEPQEYNWGYDPYFYNSPEGSYASDPSNISRIIELKKLIQSLHQNGIGVVMDVVYNHTYHTLNSPFNLIVPEYYYRFTKKGSWANGSGCGNEIATEKKMMRRFIVNSVAYWAKEYHMDGFRFDLMGLIDRQTMLEIRERVNQLDTSILIYGEPWQAAQSPLPREDRMVKGAQQNTGISIFNDHFRNAIKGDNDGDEPGFASGAPFKEIPIKKGIVGSIHYNDEIIDFAQKPEETINYVSAHDNLTLWDKLNRTVPDFSEEEKIKMDLLAQAIVFTSQGVAFMQGGEEFLRTKYGCENSYCARNEINWLKWERKEKYFDAFKYYQGLIKLRLSHPAFRMRCAEQIRKHLDFFNTPDDTIGFILEEHANDDPWRDIVVIYNSLQEEVQINLPYQAEWKIVVNARKAGVETLSQVNTGSIVVEPISASVLYR